ncbi:MAG: GAF domain-containing sensor histidine kinase [Pseudobdellovibrionaceae bacterium]
MKKAPILSNEAERLKALLDYQVLDTAPDIAYDDITLLAAAICQTPIALVSLIDSDRQWFKSKKGLAATETSRDVSFCGHAIHQKEIFVVENALHDPRFADNPLVTSAPNVVFYAGAPLINHEGHGIGTLCVIDHVPKKLNPTQLQALDALARMVMLVLESKKSAQKINNQNLEIKNFIHQISNQQSLLISTAKLTSLGQMAAGICHQINNPLAIMKLKLETLQSKLKTNQLDPEVFATQLEKSQRMVSRIAAVIKGLRDFAQESNVKNKTVVSTTKIFDSIVALKTERLALLGINLKVNKSEGALIECHLSQIAQVLNHLIENSEEALEGLSNKWIQLSAEVKADKVLISVIDNGKGVSADLVSKIMDPFFTTKDPSVGLGLGLSISHSIIDRHGGKLTFQASHPNTCFVIELPIYQAQTEQEAA